MLTPDEFAALDALLTRARASLALGPALPSAIAPGDVVQLRPGADPTWECSLMMVTKIRYDGAVQGQILRPHRGGCPEAWHSYRPPAVVRIGRAPYPEPAAAIRSWAYCPPCPRMDPTPHAGERYRAARAALAAQLHDEQLRAVTRRRQSVRRAVARKEKS